MKKIIAVLLAFIMCFVTLSATAGAITTETLPETAAADEMPTEISVQDPAADNAAAGEPGGSEMPAEREAVSLVRTLYADIPALPFLKDIAVTVTEQAGDAPMTEVRITYLGQFLMNLMLIPDPQNGYMIAGSDLTDGEWFAFDPNKPGEILSRLITKFTGEEQPAAEENADPEPAEDISAEEATDPESDPVSDLGGEDGLGGLMMFLPMLLSGEGDTAQSLSMLAGMLFGSDAEKLYAALKPVTDQTVFDMNEQGITFSITVSNTDVINIAAALHPIEQENETEDDMVMDIGAISDILSTFATLLPEGSITVRFEQNASGMHFELLTDKGPVIALQMNESEGPLRTVPAIDPQKLYVIGNLTKEQKTQAYDTLLTAVFRLAINVVVSLPEEVTTGFLNSFFTQE